MFNVKVRNKENPGEKETHNAKQWCTRLSQKKKRDNSCDQIQDEFS